MTKRERLSEFEKKAQETAEEFIGRPELVKELQIERDELKYLLDQATDLVIPGETDTGDAYLKLLRKAESEREQALSDLKLAREALAGVYFCNATAISPEQQSSHRPGATYIWRHQEIADQALHRLDERNQK